MPALSGRYYHGWYAVRGMPLYVAAGVGESAVSLRVNCPAEVAVFDIWAR